MTLRLDVVFDVPDGSPYHRPTLDAVGHALAAQGVDARVNVVTTDTIDDTYLATLPDAVVIGPGSPYRVPAAAEAVIRSARERGVPLVGT